MSIRPPQADIDAALEVEASVTDETRDLYLECLSNKPMTARKTDQELRDGCILTFSVYERILYRARDIHV